jgi:hypothetical protein
LVWLVVAAVGAGFGLFVRPKTIVIVGVSLFVVDVVGFIIASMSSSDMIWQFGIGAMVIPMLTALLATGAHVIRAARAKF